VCARACGATDEIIKAYLHPGGQRAGCVMGRPSHFLDGHVQQCNIEFTTELLFVWRRATRQSEFRPSVRTVEVRAHRKQLLHCARDDGREGSTQQRKTHAARAERETPADTTFMLLGCVSVSLSPRRRPPPTWPPDVSLLFAASRASGMDAFDEIQIPGIHSIADRFSDATLASSKKSIVRRLQMNPKGCFFLIGNWKSPVLQLLVIGFCFSSAKLLHY
jgi:hypothetical protein